jgi:hypothetical protein
MKCLVCNYQRTIYAVTSIVCTVNILSDKAPIRLPEYITDIQTQTTIFEIGFSSAGVGEAKYPTNCPFVKHFYHMDELNKKCLEQTYFILLTG